MNFPEPEKTPVAAESLERKALLELRKAHTNLRAMFHLLTLCCLMVTGTLFVIIFKQVSLLRHDLDDMSPHVTEYNTVFVPQLEAVRVKLEDFSKSNESILPILRRYFPTNAPKGTPAIAPVSTSKP